ncbi:MAG: hypothetical protein CSA18_03895 [Deltaproteobacteria bacterium]|nr:MAG: hypothetical protein CSB21_00475 [Deltaproteobacteria bacterium]PIE74701.1 MAG: hypothetical protein CSA18_03895 [Deltaproteobacteria bacterium]
MEHNKIHSKKIKIQVIIKDKLIEIPCKFKKRSQIKNPAEYIIKIFRRVPKKQPDKKTNLLTDLDKIIYSVFFSTSFFIIDEVKYTEETTPIIPKIQKPPFKRTLEESPTAILESMEVKPKKTQNIEIRIITAFERSPSLKKFKAMKKV